jgi:CBS domain-containing protein/gamma-glutamylcysteine synthetase
MGEQKVSRIEGTDKMNRFVQSLLEDVQSLEYMIDNDWFEKDIVRIGAEQEMFMVDEKNYKPACVVEEALELMKDMPYVETELAKFNLETNLTPREFAGSCLSDLEKENFENLEKIRERLGPMGVKIVLTGILPTLKKADLNYGNLTPKPRYRALMEAINSQLRQEFYELRLSGIDELLVRHDSPLLEACNTSFQIHYQVSPHNFAKYYNIAQALAGPTLSVAVNSPIVFGRRLWHESRIALFQQSIDTRTTHDHMRELSPRVSFGKDWLKESILEIYKEDIARFRVLLAADVEEDSLAKIRQGQVPKLQALQVHNSTVYRWNRPCYGISPNGKPHLRIENRVLPSGPTVVDETANAAFWLGCMTGMGNQYEEVSKYLGFEDCRDNIAKGAQFGLDSKFNWLNDKKYAARDLIIQELLPLAKEGLQSRNIDSSDIDLYLGIVEERTKAHMNGARWMLRGYTHLSKKVGNEEALTVLTAAIIQNQEKEVPVHKWPQPDPDDLEDYSPSSLKVGEFMETDLITVRRDDSIEMAAQLMDWRKIRYIPVEDKSGRLVGLVSQRLLMRHYTKKNINNNKPLLLEEIMIQKPISIHQEASILQALRLMREHKIGCLPVVEKEELVGVITETDFLRITSRLLEKLDVKPNQKEL